MNYKSLKLEGNSEAGVKASLPSSLENAPITSLTGACDVSTPRVLFSESV